MKEDQIRCVVEEYSPDFAMAYGSGGLSSGWVWRERKTYGRFYFCGFRSK